MTANFAKKKINKNLFICVRMSTCLSIYVFVMDIRNFTNNFPETYIVHRFLEFDGSYFS